MQRCGVPPRVCRYFCACGGYCLAVVLYMLSMSASGMHGGKLDAAYVERHMKLRPTHMHTYPATLVNAAPVV